MEPAKPKPPHLPSSSSESPDLPEAGNTDSGTNNPRPAAGTNIKSHYGPSDYKLSGIGRKLLNDIEFDQDEELVCEIRKHPFGLFMIYLFGTLVTGSFLIATTFAGLYLEGDPLESGLQLENFKSVFIILGFLLTTISAIVTAIAAFLYRNSVVLVTSEKIAQLLYITLFNRKISQLSIGDLQDVTVKQKGIFPHLFNYGTLIVETAGEQQNYTFTFTPHPYQCSKDIVGAHERNLKQYGN